jgi:hypothetical protein
MIRKLLKDCLTGRDNETYDVVRVLILSGGLSFIFYAGVAVFKTGTFAMQDFGIGLGAILGGGGAGVGLKSKTEPEVK